MTAGLLITFREGLEAFLVLGIVLSYLNRAGLKRYNKWVYAAALLGIVSAFVLAVIFQLSYNGFESGIGKLYLKLFIMGFAVAVLSYMMLWMSRKSCGLMGEVERAVETAVTTGSIVAICLLAYSAVLREGFETVLFLGAIFGDELTIQVFYGGVLGLILSAAVTIGIFKGLRSLPIRYFFKITGVLILLIAAGLLTNMIGILQELQLMPVIVGTLFDLSWFVSDTSEVGVFFKALFGYTHSPSLMQVVSYLVYSAFALTVLVRTGSPKRRPETVREASAT